MILMEVLLLSSDASLILIHSYIDLFSSIELIAPIHPSVDCYSILGSFRLRLFQSSLAYHVKEVAPQWKAIYNAWLQISLERFQKMQSGVWDRNKHLEVGKDIRIYVLANNTSHTMWIMDWMSFMFSVVLLFSIPF